MVQSWQPRRSAAEGSGETAPPHGLPLGLERYASAWLLSVAAHLMLLIVVSLCTITTVGEFPALTLTVPTVDEPLEPGTGTGF